MIVIPKQELPQDVEYYKGQLNGNALLQQAGHLAAKKKRFLQDKTLTDDQIVRKIKPLSGKLRHTNKRLRGLPIGGAGESAGDDEGLVTTALEKWMNKMIKNTEAYPKSTQQQQRRELPKTPPSSRILKGVQTSYLRTSIFPTPPTTPLSSRNKASQRWRD